MTNKLFGCLFAVGLALAACGGSEDNGGSGGAGGGGGSEKVSGSCHNEKGGFCKDFIGSSFTEEQAKAMCPSGSNSTFAATACPTASVKGTCVVDKGADDETRLRYYEAFPAAASKTQCTNLMGEWQDP